MINGRYRQPQRLGATGLEGNFSLLFRATDIQTDREVAVKFLHPQYDRDLYRRTCFTREAQLLDEFVGVPNVLQRVEGEQVLAIPVTGPGGLAVPIPLLYFTCELAAGSLRDYIYSGANNARDSLILFRHLCKGMQRLHTMRIAHRDLKPGNCLLFPGKIAKIADLGTARRLADPPLLMNMRYDMPVGDMRYSALELFCGFGNYVDTLRTTDIFSLGAILFELFTRQILADLIYDRTTLTGLVQMFQQMPEADRRDRLHALLPGLAGRLPEFPANGLVPSSVRDRLTNCYKSLADLDYRRRARVSFDWIFGQVNICLAILEHEDKYRRWLELRRQWRQNRAEKGGLH